MLRAIVMKTMHVLPDYIEHGLRVVFCGTAAGTESAARGRYYADPGNEFWQYLFQAGFVPRRLSPSDDVTITEHGIGLTDLAKNVAASSDRGLASKYDIDAFVTTIAKYAPAVVCFHGKEAARQVSRSLGHGSRVSLGVQPWRIGDSHVFVVPSASGANRNAKRLEGKASRVEWFVELHKFVERVAS